MLFSLISLAGYWLWRRNELRRLNFEWSPTPFSRFLRNARCQGFIIPDLFAEGLIGLEDLRIRSDDIVISTFPKSGTTWMQEMVYLIANDLDFEKARSANLDTRSPFLEDPNSGRYKVDDCPSPRVIKTHVPYVLLPRAVRDGQCKMIYVYRNPKDVAVSLHHFVKSFPKLGYEGTLHNTAETLIEGTCMNGPYWKHLQQYWEQRHRPNILITSYEAMQKDLPDVVRAVATFLGKQLTEDQVMKVAKWCSFSEMKSNPTANYGWYKEAQLGGMEADFLRKGVIGDWKNQLSNEDATRFDEMYARELKPRGIEIIFDMKE